MYVEYFVSSFFIDHPYVLLTMAKKRKSNQAFPVTFSSDKRQKKEPRNHSMARHDYIDLNLLMHHSMF